MRVGRVRGATALEARNGVKRIQRALAARDAEIERVRGGLLDEFNDLVSVLREVTTLAAERADSLDTFCLHQAGRFNVLARVHGMLLRDGGPVDFETLVWDELAAAISPAEEDRITIAGPPVLLERRPAELLALTIHELTCNALKFGALAEDEGRVEATWTVAPTPDATLHLSWTETNASVFAGLPKQRGFGRELIETVLPRRLNAETRFFLAGSGLRCEIALPLGARTQESLGEMAAAA